MISQFSETWGSAYLQIIVIILVFALGIPTILFQISISNDIRRIIQKQIKLIWWFILITFLVGASLVYIWILHPCPGNVSSPFTSLLANLLLSFVIVISFSILCIRLIRNSRDQIIRRIEKKIIKYFFKTGDRSESIIKESVNDLIYLGEQGSCGDEKQIILESISSIFQNTVLKRRNDNFLILIDLVYGLQKIVTNKEKEGNGDNFILSVKCLSEIINNPNSLLTNVEKDIIINVICDIGQFSLMNKSETITLLIFQEFDNHCSALFKFGKSALNEQQYLFAVASLNKLESLYQDDDMLKVDTRNYLLGLMSHFWFSGDACRKRATRFLKDNLELFQPSFTSCVEHSILFHENSVDYITVGLLYELKKHLKNVTTNNELLTFLILLDSNGSD
jgi:hypothetical protein